MENNRLEVSDELIQNLSIDQIAELKVEVEDLLEKLDSIIERCDETLNS